LVSHFSADEPLTVLLANPVTQAEAGGRVRSRNLDLADLRIETSCAFFTLGLAPRHDPARVRALTREKTLISAEGRE
jgi:hypothetical protein